MLGWHDGEATSLHGVIMRVRIPHRVPDMGSGRGWHLVSTVNRRKSGSIPGLPTKFGFVAQLEERHSAKVEDAGSNPVETAKFRCDALTQSRARGVLTPDTGSDWFRSSIGGAPGFEPGGM